MKLPEVQQPSMQIQIKAHPPTDDIVAFSPRRFDVQ